MTDTKTLALVAEVERLTKELAAMTLMRDSWRSTSAAMKAERDSLLPLTTAKDILEQIVRVSAMDYEYRSWARCALDVISEGKAS